MNRLFLLLAIVVAFTACTTEENNNYTITGTTDQEVNAYVLLQYRDHSNFITVDSMMLTDQGFNFSGTIDYPRVYYIRIKETKSMIPFFLENADISINMNIENIDQSVIEGSASQLEYEAYLDGLDHIDGRIEENYYLYQKAKELNEFEKEHKYDSLFGVLYNEREVFIKDFVLENNATPISPYITYRNAYQFELSDLIEITDNFNESLSPSVYTGLLKDFIKTLKRVSVGQLYVTFTQLDTSDNKIHISSLVGDNYLLIDFWASWCSPCRVENPNLVAIYNDFHDQGFDIVGVSFDTKKENWIKAIEDDGLLWTQLSDLLGWNNGAGKLYGIRSIPSNILLDKHGIIIAKNLKGNDLRERLEGVFQSNI